MATITPTMVSNRPELEVVAGVDVGSVDAGAGFAFSITNTAVVRPGTVNVPLANDEPLTVASAEFCWTEWSV